MESYNSKVVIKNIHINKKTAEPGLGGSSKRQDLSSKV
jgi:hypothetical protein